MPLFDYECEDCAFTKEHFIMDVTTDPCCPKCKSKQYKRQLSTFISNVEYGNPQENYERKIKPHISDTYAVMGKEALDGDMRTAENIFGSSRVEQTFTSTDE